MESLYSRVILNPVYAMNGSDGDDKLEKSVNLRRKFEGFVWLTLHYFFQAVPIPGKAVSRSQLKHLIIWAKGDMKYGKSNPHGAPFQRTRHSISPKMTADASLDSSDDEVYISKAASHYDAPMLNLSFEKPQEAYNSMSLGALSEDEYELSFNENTTY